MKSEKRLSNKMKNGIKKVLFVALKSNAISSGCFIIYQPKTPKGFEKFKNIKWSNWFQAKSPASYAEMKSIQIIMSYMNMPYTYFCFQHFI